MTVKSVVDIDVNDEEFTRFQSIYNKFHAQAEKMPGIWAGVNKANKEEAKTFGRIVSLMMAQKRLMDDAERQEKRGNEELKRSVGFWERISRGAKQLSTSVSSVTTNLLRWAATGALTTGALGLVGMGGLWGLDRLAGAVGGQRRAALGLGTTYGEQRAFELNFGRVVEPNSFLSGVQESLLDVTKRYSLYGAGLTENDLAGRDTAQVGALLLRNLKGLADQTSPQMMAQMLQARGLDQFVSLQDMERLRGTPVSELNDYLKSFSKDQFGLGLSPANQRAWQDFQVQMTRAGSKIENVFVRGLANAHIPERLTQLSDAIARAIDTFMGSKEFSKWLDEAGDGLQKFATYVGSGEFQANVKSFVSNVGIIVQGTADFVKWVYGLMGKDAPKSKTGSWFKDQTTFTKDGFFSSPLTHIDRAVREFTAGLNNGVPMNWSAQERGIESHYGLPSGVLDQILKHEGRWTGRGWAVSKTGARGPFQFMPETARLYGVKNPDDFSEAAGGAGHLMSDLLRQFHGDMEKALAAYNWRPSAVAQDVREHGAAWRDFLPQETKNYISSIVRAMNRGTQVKIHDNTGGAVVIQTDQVAQPFTGPGTFAHAQGIQ